MKKGAKKTVAKRKSQKPRWVAVSGGFDPLHVGHVRMFRDARKLGERLVVILNNDHWLENKKGFAFMPQKERAELILSFPFVDRVVLTQHRPGDADRSVVKALRRLRPHIFVNGGDRKPDGDPVPEVAICEELGIKVVYNVGRGGKIQSSSWMIRDAARGVARSVRPWGEFYGWDGGEKWYLKTIYVKPESRLSLQYHNHRSEHWVLVEGDASAVTVKKGGKEIVTPLTYGEAYQVEQGTPHRLTSKKGGIVVEVALGKFDENDIVRLHDDYDRLS